MFDYGSGKWIDDSFALPSRTISVQLFHNARLIGGSESVRRTRRIPVSPRGVRQLILLVFFCFWILSESEERVGIQRRVLFHIIFVVNKISIRNLAPIAKHRG